MSTVYLKVHGVDDDFDSIDIEGTSTIRDLKNAILSTKSTRLVGFTPSDIKVYHIGSSPDSEAIGPPENIVKKIGSYSDPAFFIIIPGSLKTIVNNDPKLTGNAVPGYKFNKNDRSVGVLPDAIYPEQDEQHSLSSILQKQLQTKPAVDFFERNDQPIPVREFDITGNTLSTQMTKLLSVANFPREVNMPAPDKDTIDTPVPTGVVNAKIRETIASAIDSRVFPIDFEVQKMETPEVSEFLPEFKNRIRSTIKKLKCVPISLSVLKKERRSDDIEKYIWIADGTSSTGKIFNAYELCNVEDYCRENTHCFEATHLHKYSRFFIDIDGFAPAEFTEPMFSSIESRIRYKLFTLFGK